MKKFLTIFITMIVTAAVTFFVTAWLMQPESPPLPPQERPSATSDPGKPADSTEPEAPAMDYMEKAKEIQGYVNRYFIGEIDDKAMGDAIAEGMIAGLGDEWSYYIPKESYQSYLENVSNSYVGIGVTITAENIDRGFSVTDVSPESPAYYAGLEIGDLIVAVEGQKVNDGDGTLTMNETRDLVRGAEGTDVTLTVERDGVAKDYTITRRSIKVVNVTTEQLPNDLVYIRIRNFEEGASKDTIAAIKDAMNGGAKGLIFDVRYNPGGLKRELVDLLDYILPAGPLFCSVDYSGRESVDYSDEDHIEIPMAVLVNYDSYSAAEFFAAALQEYGAATIIGEQTYGKGYFQSSIVLSDGSAINISMGKYTTPKGVSLVGKGITPDKVVELTDEQKLDLYYNRLDRDNDDQLQAAILELTSGR